MSTMSTFTIGTIEGTHGAQDFTASFSILCNPTEDVYDLFVSHLNDGFEKYQYHKDSICIQQAIPLRSSTENMSAATDDSHHSMYNLYIGSALNTVSQTVHLTVIATSTFEAQQLLAAQKLRLSSLDATLIIENVRVNEDGTRKVRKLKPRILEQVVYDPLTSSVVVQQLLTPNNLTVHSYPYKLFVME